MNKIGILGGTFDPIHNGHLFLAQNALDQFSLEKVLFMPSGTPPHKNAAAVSPEQDRAEMVRLAIQGRPGFDVSLMELGRQGKTYTADTAKQLEAQYPLAQFYYIVGADALRDMEDWWQPEEIFKRFIILVAEREGENCDVDPIIKRLTERFDARIKRLNVPRFDVSSTEIRERFKRGELPVSLMPEAVARYGKERGLYV